MDKLLATLTGVPLRDGGEWLEYSFYLTPFEYKVIAKPKGDGTFKVRSFYGRVPPEKN